MENYKSKSLTWPQGILIAIVALCGTFGISWFWPVVSPKASEAQTKQTINIKDVAAKAETQQRIQKLKAALLTSWQKEAQTKGISYLVPSKFLGSTIEQAQLSSQQKVIALSFDDGPWPNSTAKVLDILKKENIKATFFLVGQNLKNYPDLAKRIVAEEHVLGNHTWHHWYHHMNPQAAAFEIESTTNLIYETTGVKTNLFRPPGGIMTNGVYDYAKNKKYATIMWSSDSVDYSRPAVSRLINNVMREAKPGGIVLMHDGGGDRSHTVEALPQIISNFRKQGYRFVTIPELLEMQEKQQNLTTAKKPSPEKDKNVTTAKKQ